MKVTNGVRLIVRTIVVGTLFSAAAWAAPGTCVAKPGSVRVKPDPGYQSFVENPNGTATVNFDVTNNSSCVMTLDYALTVIYGPSDKDDNVYFDGQSFATLWNPKQTLALSYTVINTYGNPTDCCDKGWNYIAFEIELSPAKAGSTPQYITVPAPYGTYIYPSTSASTGTLNPAVQTKLLNCFNSPGAFPNPCPTLTPTDLLYSNGVRGKPFPAIAIVNVTDVPEPSTLLLSGAGLLGLLGNLRRKRNL